MTPGAPDSGLAPVPLPNRLYRPRRKWTPAARRGPAPSRLRLGCAKARRPRPRGIARFFGPAPDQPEDAPHAQTGWRSGQSRASPSLRRNSLIYGKIQGIRPDSGSVGLAIVTDSLACTRTCAPDSLEPVTGNFVPRSRDSGGRDPLWSVPDHRGAALVGPIPSTEARTFMGSGRTFSLH